MFSHHLLTGTGGFPRWPGGIVETTRLCFKVNRGTTLRNDRVEDTNDWNGFRAVWRCSTSESPLPALALWSA